MTGVPDYFFRVRENGAAVYRVDAENRHRRIDMDQIAVVNIRNGEIKPHGGRDLSEADLAAIRDWIATRTEVLKRRATDDVLRTIDQINLLAGWAQARATPRELEAVTDDLLLAMHDLRSVLVRKKSERLADSSRTAPSGQ